VTPTALLARRVRLDGASPFLTWYDDATGERIELSAVSLANAVAKTANLLADELDVEPGERVGVRLPAHWQTASVLLGLWAVGACVDLDGAATRVQVVAEARLGEPGVEAAEIVLALALRPLGGRLTAAPGPGILDHGAEVPAQPDVFAGEAPDGDSAALVLGGRTLSGHELGALASLPTGGRMLALADWTTLAGLRAGLLDPLAADGSAVLVAHPHAPGLASRATQERATATWGLADPLPVPPPPPPPPTR